MTDYVETDGWLHIISGSDTLKVYCENIRWQPVVKGKIKHYSGGINLGIPIFKKYVILTAMKLWINTNAKITNYINYFTTWLEAGTVSVKVQRTVAGAFELLDGTNDTFPMMVKNDLGRIEKISYGDQEVYFINKLIMEQSGVAS